MDTLTLPEQEALWKRVVKIVSHPESRPSRRSYASPSTVRRDPERGPIGRMTKAQVRARIQGKRRLSNPLLYRSFWRS